MTRTTLILLSLLSLLLSCSNPDPRITAIEADIKKQAMGLDIGYQPGKLDTVVIATKAVSLPDFEKELGVPISSDYDKAIRVYTNIYEEARRKGDASMFNVWKWFVDRMKRLQKMKADDVDFSVYKYTYTINNIFNPEERNTVTNYYFFNYRDSLIGSVPNSKMQRLISTEIASDLHPYCIAMIQLQTGLE